MAATTKAVMVDATTGVLVDGEAFTAANPGLGTQWLSFEISAPATAPTAGWHEVWVNPAPCRLLQAVATMKPPGISHDFGLTLSNQFSGSPDVSLTKTVAHGDWTVESGRIHGHYTWPDPPADTIPAGTLHKLQVAMPDGAGVAEYLVLHLQIAWL